MDRTVCYIPSCVDTLLHNGHSGRGVGDLLVNYTQRVQV